ncbi:MAG: Ig-like domain-containing protein [Methanomicrobiales archaeon]|nr:Ig-like domain-containing protein [Methanomicrobiales archaeon]
MARCIVIVVTILLALCLMAQVAVAEVTDDQINSAIGNGVGWLSTHQNADGSWTADGTDLPVLQTSLAVLKLVDYAREQKQDPFGESYPYRVNIQKGLEFIFGKVRTESPDIGAIWDYPLGPDPSPYVFGQDPNAPPIIVETSAAIMAVANTETPDAITPARSTYRQVVQNAVNYLGDAQDETGGWASFDQDPWLPDGLMCQQMSEAYERDVCLPGPFPPDQLNSGFAALALQYADKAFGIETEGRFKVGLGDWGALIQDGETVLDPEQGGAFLLLPSPEYPRETRVFYTGLLLIEQRVAGSGTGAPEVQSAVQYISDHWLDDDEYSWNPNWKDNYEILYIATTGLSAMRIQTIPGAGTSGDWYGEFAAGIVNGQSLEGSWPWGTDRALLSLEGKRPDQTMTVKKTASPTEVKMDETVLYTYLVENTGKSPIYDLSLTDDKLGPVTGLQSGDENGNLILDPGETWIFEASSQPIRDTVTNIATATGTDLWGWGVMATSEPVMVTVNHVPDAFDQSAETFQDIPVPITLTASDADEDDILVYTALAPAYGTLEGNSQNLVYTPLSGYVGIDSFLFSVSDGIDTSNQATVTITVKEKPLDINSPPVAENQSVFTQQDTQLPITLTATDTDNDLLTYQVMTPPVHGTLAGTPPELTYLPELHYYGSDHFTFYANDGESDSNLAGVDILVVHQNHPPEVTPAGPSAFCLWPPNHKYADVTVDGVTDPDGDPVKITITKITSDEPTESIAGAGGKNHVPDAFGIGTNTATLLRAERSGTGNGRVYVISFEADDGKGGVAEGTVSVCVPHDQSQACSCKDDGQDYDATGVS